MTQLGRFVILMGIGIFTISCLMWIIQDNWQYFAGGIAIFGGSLLAGIVLSIEVKHPTTPTPRTNGNQGSGNHQQRPSNGGQPYTSPPTPPPPPSLSEPLPLNQYQSSRTAPGRPPGRDRDTDPYPTRPIGMNNGPISGTWTQPTTPPPDQEHSDPLSKS